MVCGLSGPVLLVSELYLACGDSSLHFLVVLYMYNVYKLKTFTPLNMSYYLTMKTCTHGSLWTRACQTTNTIDACFIAV